MTSDLITRLSKLDAPNREVDILIGKLFPPKVIHSDGSWFEKDDIVRYPAYTASVDAAIALAARVLPGKGIDLLREAISELGKKYHWHICLKKPEQVKELPIQVCIALLRAKEASNVGN